MPVREHLLDYDATRIAEYAASSGLESFRAGQILQWIYERGAPSFEAMTNLSKALREKLAADFDLYASTIIRRAASTDGTVKLLLQWPDAATSEAVLIP